MPWLRVLHASLGETSVKFYSNSPEAAVALQQAPLSVLIGLRAAHRSMGIRLQRADDTSGGRHPVSSRPLADAALGSRCATPCLKE